MKYLNKATYIVAFFILIISNIVFSGENLHFKFRGIWVVRTSMFSKEAIDSVLSFAQENQFNHLFLQVRGRGDAFYNSEIVPKSVLVKPYNFNPLAYAVSEGHKRGLNIHAWVNVFLLWSSTGLPDDSTHLLNSHPEWMDRSITDNYRVDDQIRHNGNNGIKTFLNPVIPEVIDHLISVCRELLTHYDIDGIHLDYIRYKDMDYGYNPLAVQNFQDMSGVVLSETNLDGKSPVEIGVNMEKWDEFRRASITNFVQQCNSLILELNSDVIFSVAVKPNLWEANNRYFQAWDQWIINGYVDFVIPMNYIPVLEDFVQNVDAMKNIIPSKYYKGIILGLAVYNQNTDEVIQKIQYSKNAGFSGISIFSYDARKGNSDYFKAIIPELSK